MPRRGWQRHSQTCLHQDCGRESIEQSRYCRWHIKQDGKTTNDIFGTYGHDKQDLKEGGTRGTGFGPKNRKSRVVHEPYLVGAQLDDVDLSRYKLSKADLRGARLVNANLKSVNLLEANLSGSLIKDSNLQESKCIKATFNGAKVTNTTFFGSDFNNATLDNTDLSRSDFTQVDFTKASLVNADLSQARIVNTTFTDTDLSGVELAGAIIRSIDPVEFCHAALTSSDEITQGAGADGISALVEDRPEDCKSLVSSLCHTLWHNGSPSIQVTIVRILSELAINTAHSVREADLPVARVLKEGDPMARSLVATDFAPAVIDAPALFHETISAYHHILQSNEPESQQAAAKTLAVIAHKSPKTIPDLNELYNILSRMCATTHHSKQALTTAKEIVEISRTNYTEEGD